MTTANFAAATSAPEWLFNGTDGTLTLPVGGDILNSSGQSVLQGIQGVQGIAGGSQGIQGIQGFDGNQGVQGITGNQGIQGITGPQGPGIYESDTPPSDTDLLWYDTVNGRLYLYYDSSWVDASPKGGGSQGIQGIQGTQAAQNKLVNGLNEVVLGTDGVLTLPTGGGDEGGEIDFTKAPNSTLSGTAVVVDQYKDRLRFFEAGGTSRGAYIDLTQAAGGVNTLLNNRVSAFVNAGSFVTMDNIKATVTTSGQRGLSLAAVSGSFNIRIAGTYAQAGTTGGSTAGVSITTTPSVSIFDWNFIGAGDLATYVITDTTNNRAYRVTMHIGYLYADNMICIERLI
jgi:hypothetical protein